MSSDERSTWLATAWSEIQHIPAAALLIACAEARRTVEHPAKLIPTIVRESEPYASQLRRRLVREEAAWANRNAPRLADATDEPVDETFEVAELMRGLIQSLSTSGESRDG